jgi:hypothetical protein
VTRPRAATSRCAGHPSRPAVDACPVCGRPRCGSCARAAGCPLDRPAATGPSGAERAVRGALAGTAAALPGGLVAAEYVGAPVFWLLAPLVLGVLCGAAVARAAGAGPAVRPVAVVYAVLGTAFGFLVEGSRAPLGLDAQVLLPYAAAAAGGLLWTLPPRRG